MEHDCALDGCDETFIPKRRTQIYHHPNCAKTAANRRRMEGTAPPRPSDGAPEAATLARKLLAAEQARSVARVEAKSAKKTVEDLEDQVSRLSQELSLHQDTRPSQPEWLKRPVEKDKGHHRGTLIAFLSDVHCGETVRADEMFGYNAYDERITEMRLRRFFERTILVAKNYLAGVEYDGLVLALGGDMVSGDIHDELEQTNWCSTYEACRWLAPRLVTGIEMLAQEFGQVHVVSAPGNHGRDSKRPRSKRRSAHNADTHISHLVYDRLKGERGITFNVPEAYDVGFNVYDTRFSMEHGDNMKFNGTAEIGAIGPVKRGTLRKSRQLQNEGRPFDCLLVGHFHQYVPAYTQGFVMNGSLKGFDEYARTGHFVPEPAQQALMVCTPEHGITVNTPLIVSKRSAEGW